MSDAIAMTKYHKKYNFGKLVKKKSEYKNKEDH